MGSFLLYPYNDFLIDWLALVVLIDKKVSSYLKVITYFMYDILYFIMTRNHSGEDNAKIKS